MGPVSFGLFGFYWASIGILRDLLDPRIPYRLIQNMSQKYWSKPSVQAMQVQKLIFNLTFQVAYPHPGGGFRWLWNFNFNC